MLWCCGAVICPFGAVVLWEPVWRCGAVICSFGAVVLWCCGMMPQHHSTEHCPHLCPRCRSVWCCSFVGPFHKATKLQRQTAKSEATAPNGQYKATAPNGQSTKLQRQTGSPQSHSTQRALHCPTKLQRQTGSPQSYSAKRAVQSYSAKRATTKLQSYKATKLQSYKATKLQH